MGERIEFSTAMLKRHRDQLQKEYEEQLDTNEFDEVAPKTRVPKKTQIAKNLTSIKITKDMIPKEPKQLYKLSPNAEKKAEINRNIPELEYKFEWEPKKLEARPFEIPVEFGRDYLRDQLVDLVFQFSRLSTPQ